MQIISILLSLTLVSIAQAGLSTRIPKPKWNWHSQNTQQEFSRHKSPEERRKLSIFPKSYMKYVISSEPIYKMATHKPFEYKAKKPLMKKFNLLDKSDKSSSSNENETKQPINNNIHGKVIYDNSVDGSPRVESVVFSEEVSIEIIEDKSQESDEIVIDQMKEDIIFQNGEKELKAMADTFENKDVLSLKDVIFPPEVNMPVEVNPGNKTNEFVQVFDAPTNSKEAEIPDTVEFIFMDPAQKTKDSASISSEEDYITTEMYEEPELFRKKRGSNIIEEENLASTVAGYKFTLKDTRLTNESVFKNIHS